MNTQQYNQISLLCDLDVIEIYAICTKILLERDLLVKTNNQIKKTWNNKKQTSVFSPSIPFNRGKIKRNPANSILIDFISEDWKYLFSGNYDEERKYYVYYHTDYNKANMRFKNNDASIDFVGRPFYVGKGTGDRYKSKLRSRSHLSAIKSVSNNGCGENGIFQIFKSSLTELEALELEAKLITFFGCSSELDPKKTHFHGIKGGLLINSDPEKRPSCVSKMMRIKGC